MARLVAVGEVLLDVVAAALEPGSPRHGPIAVRAGGTPVNAAVAAVAEGAEAAVVGRVGGDAVGRLVEAELRAGGIEPLLAVDAELRTGTFVAAGTCIVADRGASAALAPGDLPERIEADVVFISPYAPAAAAEAARERADALWVTGVDAAIVRGEEDDLPALASRYRLAVVTLGPAGATATLDGVAERRTPRELLPEPLVGAGDAFAAALLLALASGTTLGDALERGCAAAVRLGRTRGRSGTPSSAP